MTREKEDLNMFIISDLMDGLNIEGVAIIQKASRGLTVNGKEFISIVLEDKSGAIEGKLWDLVPGVDYDAVLNSTFVYLSAQVQTYRDALQLRIDHIEAITREDHRVNLDLLLERAPIDINGVYGKIEADIANFENMELQMLLQVVMSKNAKAIKTYPAAMSFHHAYYGGLLQHIWEMYQLADVAAMVFPNIDVELLKTGVVLHDIGKIREYELNEVFKVTDYSKEGKMLGHIVLGTLIVNEIGKEVATPEEILTPVLHMIASHHHVLEFGSPVTPVMAEAEALCFLDELSAKNQGIVKETKDIPAGEFSKRDFNKRLKGGFTRVDLKSDTTVL